MAIYVDSLKTGKWKFRKACHLFTDGQLVDLHCFAMLKLKLRKEWFQNDTRLPHYDLTARKRKLAIHYGAIEASSAIVKGVINNAKVDS